MFKILRSLIPLGVLGGFCSLSIADAQTLPRQPPTRTQVAKALVERLRSLTDTEVLSIIKATNPDLPVTIYINYFVNTQSYTAAIKVTAPAFLNWRTFYEASCNPLFNIPPDCGLITPDSNRATKTSLDKYKDQNLKYEYTPAFVAGSAWPPALPGPDYLEKSCYHHNENRFYTTWSYYGNQNGWTGWRYFTSIRRVHGGNDYSNTSGDTQSRNKDTRTAAIMKDFNDFCLPPKLDEYFSGSYYEVDTEPVPHPDLYQGLKIAITELIALSDRTSTAFALPAGMAWGQLPNDPDICGRPDGCVREWDDDPTDPTDPGTPPGDGGSWPPYVPPTDGDTRCSIIDIPCNLRFLFVPKLSYQSHADYLKANALDRFPFNIGNAANVFKLFRPDGSQGLSSYCRHQFQFDTGLKVQVFEFRICESDIAMFWRDNVRQYLTFLMLILFFWSIYVRVSTS